MDDESKGCIKDALAVVCGEDSQRADTVAVALAVALVRWARGRQEGYREDFQGLARVCDLEEDGEAIGWQWQRSFRVLLDEAASEAVSLLEV